MTMITPSYLGETIEYSSLHACRSTLEDPTRKRPSRGIPTPSTSLVCATKRGHSVPRPIRSRPCTGSTARRKTATCWQGRNLRRSTRTVYWESRRIRARRVTGDSARQASTEFSGREVSCPKTVAELAVAQRRRFVRRGGSATPPASPENHSTGNSSCFPGCCTGRILQADSASHRWLASLQARSLSAPRGILSPAVNGSQNPRTDGEVSLQGSTGSKIPCALGWMTEGR